jgi:adenine phosphoribosyltransferase
LEYGEDELQVHQHLIGDGIKVGVIDDVLATGGTAVASLDLIDKAGAIPTGFGCLLELGGLGGRQRLLTRNANLPIEALVVQ